MSRPAILLLCAAVQVFASERVLAHVPQEHMGIQQVPCAQLQPTSLLSKCRSEQEATDLQFVQNQVPVLPAVSTCNGSARRSLRNISSPLLSPSIVVCVELVA